MIKGFAGLFLGITVFLTVSTAQTTDMLVVSSNSHGIIDLPDTGVLLALDYGTVNQPVRFTLQESDGELTIRFQPSISSTVAPMMLEYRGVPYIIDSAGTLKTIPSGDYLIYFDTVQVFAQHIENDTVFSLGMLERFSPDLPIQREREGFIVKAEVSNQGRHTLIVSDLRNDHTIYTSAGHHPRYQNQFVGQDFTNPASFQFLGWAVAEDLQRILRLMFSSVPPEAGLPIAGEQITPMSLTLPFDCSAEWQVSWGYHYSNHQNRYAVDFAAIKPGTSQGLPVRAAHAGTVYLKVFGYDQQYIDLGIAARVVAEDGITSTEYGHLDESTFRYWDASPEAIGVFEWVEVGQVAAGEVIGFVGNTGYATGAHIHFALWTYEQSIYLPNFPTLHEFIFGMPIPTASRSDCRIYP